MQPGAAGEISLSSKNKSKLRRRDPNQKASKLSNVQLDPDAPVQDQIRDLLSKNAVRVIDLFRGWDDDGSGTISKAEFRKALVALGVTASKEDLNSLFDTLDNDGSGTLEYNELNKALRRQTTLDPKLQAGCSDADLFRQLASQWHGTPVDAVTSAERAQTKQRQRSAR